MSTAIQIPTISYEKTIKALDDESKTNPTLFLTFHDHLKQSFPLLHKLHPPEIINEYSLLYKIPGTPNTNTKQVSPKPILLCSHLDVVPAPNDHNAWVHDPFSGTIVDNMIWGRGGTYVEG